MLNIAIDAAAMGIWSINIQTLEFIPSLRLKEMFGFYPDEQMTYEAAIAQIDAEYQSLVTNAVEASINTGAKCDVEYPLRGFHDGKLRWVKGVGNVSYDNKDKPNYFTGVLHDITAHKEDDIRKTDFIAMASHELRTPLTSLQAYVQMLAAKAKKDGDTFALGALEKANIQVKKMAALINGFLNTSSFEAGKIYLNEQSFDIGDLMSEIVGDMLLTTQSHTIELATCHPLIVNADRDKIGQVINNFLSNAIKYSPKGTNVDVSCHEINGMLHLGVKDAGPGISPDDQKKLFDRYYRIENALTKHISGFGLGLYLSAEIIHQHNGRVWVESEIGKGSTFYFSLPLSKSVVN
jgi:two-component system CheB/CheR fusion protein